MDYWGIFQTFAGIFVAFTACALLVIGVMARSYLAMFIAVTTMAVLVWLWF